LHALQKRMQATADDKRLGAYWRAASDFWANELRILLEGATAPTPPINGSNAQDKE